jgi:GntR family transcriptional regulator
MARTTPIAIAIVTGDSRSISRQIVDAIRMQITTGDLPQGVQVPSVRGLAQQLGINPNTVAKSYGQLTSEGWLESRQGLGLFVAVRRQQFSAEERERRFDDAVGRFVSEVVAIQYPHDAAVARIEGALEALAPRKIA